MFEKLKSKGFEFLTLHHAEAIVRQKMREAAEQRERPGFVLFARCDKLVTC
jgi:hypothetical protein